VRDLRHGLRLGCAPTDAVRFRASHPSVHQLSTHKWRSSERKTNLSYDDRPFIGRSKERSDLRSKIAIKGNVSCRSPDRGHGKTRLSKQVAAELIDEFPDGVWFVDCETLIDSQDLVAGIATVLPFGTGAESTNASRVLTRRRILIVLDCFENSVAQGGLLEELLQHASGLSILITSRIVLASPVSTSIHSRRCRSPPAAERRQTESPCLPKRRPRLNGFEVTVKNRKLLGELANALREFHWQSFWRPGGSAT